VRRKPYSVILLDEVEKAHPDVFNILLQVLEDGRLTDSHGRTVDFRNTVIVMTSNLGSAQIQELVGDREAQRAAVMDAVGALPSGVHQPGRRSGGVRAMGAADRRHYRDPAGPSAQPSAERELKLELSPEAMDKLIAVGYDPVYGARPLKRAIQRWIENPLAQLILSGSSCRVRRSPPRWKATKSSLADPVPMSRTRGFFCDFWRVRNPEPAGKAGSPAKPGFPSRRITC
jgi:ATP-dependent Clp protease ATP-binding subunit ClpB